VLAGCNWGKTASVPFFLTGTYKLRADKNPVGLHKHSNVIQKQVSFLLTFTPYFVTKYTVLCVLSTVMLNRAVWYVLITVSMEYTASTFRVIHNFKCHKI
jgi:hypothetical protein